MKNIYYPYYLLLFVLLMFSSELFCQQPPGKSDGERVQVVTDRNIYVAGETILFSAVIYSEAGKPSDQFSHILYGELIRPDGSKVMSRKFLLENFSGDGCLTIPEETVTGIYYLKFYTRYMRNFSTTHYRFIRLTIINADKSETLPVKTDSTLVKQNIEIVQVEENPRFFMTLPDKESFKPREEITLQIKCNQDDSSVVKSILTVVPENTNSTTTIRYPCSVEAGTDADYIPETRGLSLTGQMKDKETGKTMSGARVNLSIIGEKDLQVVQTDTSGRFFFALPGKTGSNDIFLCGEEVPGSTPEIFIDNDFCTKSISLPSTRLTLTDTERETALRLAVNHTISRVYQADTAAGAADTLSPEASFYGAPSEVLKMDNYIEMPTLKEYFTELPVMVKLRKVDGERRFTFYTNEPEMFLYKPLMLVDWVAVENIEKILAMSPSEIDRVELVNAPYFKGDIMYGGIISFISKKGNFAGIDLPTSGTFVNYQFLSDCSADLQLQPGDSPNPDARNTIFWSPQIGMMKDGTARISFRAPDTPGVYIIDLKIINKQGEVSKVSKSLKVQ